MKKICRFLVLALVLCMCFPAVTALAASFSDVPRTHWAEIYIDNLSRRGLINGYPDGTFLPGNNITFGETFKLITVATYSQYVYEPVEGYHWAYPYAQIISRVSSPVMKDVILIEDFETADKLNEYITREEIIVILGKVIYSREFRSISYDEILEYPRIKELTDYEQIAEDNRKWVEVAMMYEVINGYEDDTFRPGNLLTRAEVAKIIYQYYYKV